MSLRLSRLHESLFLPKGLRRRERRAERAQAAAPTRLGFEPLEDRRMLAILIGPSDDLESINDDAPPAGQNLGSEPTVAIENFTLGDNGEGGDLRDTFIYRAHRSGKLLVGSVEDVGFDGMMVDVQDSSGASLIGGPVAAGLDRTLPVVEAELYYIVVTDTVLDEDGGFYSLEIENFAAPIPASVNLTPGSDTGSSNADGVTSDTTPTFVIQNDLAAFLPSPPFGSNTGTIDGAPGYDTELVATNLSTGAETVVDATRLGTSSVWTATTPVLAAGDYLVSARTRVDDASTPAGAGPFTGFSLLSEPIFVTIQSGGGVTATADLIASSDSGMFDNDNVTNIQQPAFQGVAPAGHIVRLYANGNLVGSTVAGTDGSDGGLGGTSSDGNGIWEITSEPLADGTYDITLEVEDAAGNIANVDPRFHELTEIDVVIDTLAPNTPFLDLLSDTGRSDVDNITLDNTPQMSMTTSDPNIALAQVLFTDNLKYRLYDRFENNAEVLIYDSAADANADNATTAGDMFTSLTQLTRTLAALDDGSHNLKLEVEDRAGNFSPDFILEIIVDTAAPPASFGLPDAASVEDGLAADSDSGNSIAPATAADRITSDATPRLWGRAEADSVIRVYLDSNSDGIVDGEDVFLGQTVAVPFDGNDAFPDGYWELVSTLDLNQVAGMGVDGLRSLLVTAEDVAGNPLPGELGLAAADQLDIFLDTQGPQVNAVRINELAAEDYDLFDPKPSENGPTPLISQLVIDFVDQPIRVADDFVYDALQNEIASSAGNYLLVGDHVGVIPIQSAAVTASSVGAGMVSTATVTLTFFEPLPDDRFTLTISDHLVDPAGNSLDGETSADEPQEMPEFPSGDGVPGGDFTARFTVDARPELGTFVAQDISLDLNGNFVWDPANAQIGGDATNVDKVFKMNVANPMTGAIDPGGYGVHDLVFVGKFGPLNQLIVGDDAVFIVDVSGSTSDPFGGDPVGDQNSDGSPNTILDAEIAAFKALNQQLIDRGLGNSSNVSIVAFDASSSIIDVDPATAGVQVSTTPLADADGDGMRDIDQALMALRDGGSTNYEAGFQDAISVVGTVGTAPGNGNVIFLSDGEPNTPTGSFDEYTDEVATLRDTLGMNVRAFGVGPGASLPPLQAIDPDAVTFSDTNELLEVFGGGAGGGAAQNPSGFDQLAVYGWAQDLGSDRWLIDANSDGVVNAAEGDIMTIQAPVAGFNVLGALPIAGNFDGNLSNGDEIGLYYAGRWALDTNRNFVIDAADTFVGGDLFGYPVVGDFDGNGEDDLGVFNNNTWNFDLNSAGFDGFSDDSLIWGFPGVLDRPVAADMDQDGVDDIGLWVPRNSSQDPRERAEWFFLISADPVALEQEGEVRGANGGGRRVTGTINTLDHPYEPVPFGHDLYAEFGDELALPIVGNFDPPVAADVANPPPADTSSSSETGDFNNDGLTAGSDFLAWQRGVGMSSSEEVGLGDGDGDNDGAVDDSDLDAWEAGYGSEMAPSAQSALQADGDVAAWEANYDNGGFTGGDFLALQRGPSSAAPASAAASSVAAYNALAGLQPGPQAEANDEALAQQDAVEIPVAAIAPRDADLASWDAAFDEESYDASEPDADAPENGNDQMSDEVKAESETL